MRSGNVYAAVDAHTEGMPVRVITGGVGALPGASMSERRERFMRERDDLRTLLMYEPRGHSAMSGAILQPPTRPDADWGVLFIEVTDCLPMCGHGSVGVATVLVETGMVPVVEPVTLVRLDTPAGLVTAAVEVRDGHAVAVTLDGVPSYLVGSDRVVDVPGFGEVRYDLAYGGNFYPVVDVGQFGIPFERGARDRLVEAGLRLIAAVDAADAPVHPQDASIAGCRHAMLLAPDSTARHSRNAMVIHPGYLDRSPCGTGTCARLAQLHARGELAVGDEFVNESFIGGRFVGRVTGTTAVAGIPAVLPAFTGRAWITGMAQYLLDPTDPFPAGFLV